MKIIENLTSISFKNAIVTSGTFDGVHFGHKKILDNLVNQAQSLGGESVVMTYWPHPRFVLGKDAGMLKLLNTFDEKARLLEDCGIDYLVKVLFTREFSQLTSQQFVQDVLIGKLNVRKLIIGYDHRFGRDQEGSFEYLSQNQDKLGFQVEEIPRQDIDHVGVSSTRIRKALEKGDVELANEHLGWQYLLSGIVTKGEQLGRKIGFPTANIYVTDDFKLIPGDGVYAVTVKLKSGIFKGMLNIGNRPTVNGHKKTIEVNIFDFDQDIYGQIIEVSFVKQLRKEQKFEGLVELRQQLQIDKLNAIEAIKNIEV
ncbi:MAG: bifunctional riboflavin kinase/FAD synthetase [Cyclobacteriaceae bacterium]